MLMRQLSTIRRKMTSLGVVDSLIGPLNRS
jgi:hypothetical protein